MSTEAKAIDASRREPNTGAGSFPQSERDLSRASPRIEPFWPFDGRGDAARFGDGAWIALAALGLYLALARQGFYAADGEGFVYWVSRGHTSHPHHFLYLPIVAWVHGWLAVWWADAFVSLRFCSALGTALGVFACHAAMRAFGVDRWRALSIVATVALCPAVMTFATVVEVHGVFFLFASAAWWVFANAVRTGAMRWWIGLGLMTGLAASVHATGHLLPCCFAALPIVRRGDRSMGRVLASIGVAGLVHLGCAMAISAGYGQTSGITGQVSFLGELAGGARLAEFSMAAWNEWIVAFFPISLACWVAARAPHWRGLVVMFALILTIYLIATTLLIGSVDEHGAYLLPLALPASCLGIAWLGVGRRLTIWPLCASVVSAFVLFGPGSRFTDFSVEVEALARAARAERAFVICDDTGELKSLARFAPDVDTAGVAVFLSAAVQAGFDYAATCAYFDQTLTALAQQQRPLWITERALHLMQNGEWELARRFARQHLPTRYALRESGEAPCRWIVLTER